MRGHSRTFYLPLSQTDRSSRGDILGPYGSIASNRARPIWTWWYHVKQFILKPMLGRRPMPMHYLAVQAFALTKLRS
ncbi:hypothetical protein DF3PA_200020 [Candidatus Defluviicoccus seviourii]|uniref:Uncharacterized protein n=1 Tax=Candidatus Defluviicoccus seviourii TaxID=2565273 RepID=A0A564WED2_9PROT|nr:hypothetical protein DF3PA_200020 [Candidatus Defluviicoccus seviourii]